MTIKIKNNYGMELFSFEADYVSNITIGGLFGPDVWDVRGSFVIFESNGKPLPMMNWNINIGKKKSVLLSIDYRELNLYTVSLFQTNENGEEELIVPETWEQVVEWGR
jgi:hypothetical protein